ncbi:ATP-binding cassette, subfamily B (MDR/TAP), member 1 [Kwoniella mangroviensis CBS 10435]|uniref:ATP-binding cassette, subfamily B (MDR/TAP), member 1 n=1 Tax=Kwoniella mangroviensis CBS 10435 TaxID=1331196 RepID=A0A1B9ISN3_9TREE|nr:ATP-binding cassette, subfamily B (MDR/TAP), member 1 [Kwoniella mangroviensis CBS 10435]
MSCPPRLGAVTDPSPPPLRPDSPFNPAHLPSADNVIAENAVANEKFDLNQDTKTIPGGIPFPTTMGATVAPPPPPVLPLSHGSHGSSSGSASAVINEKPEKREGSIGEDSSSSTSEKHPESKKKGLFARSKKNKEIDEKKSKEKEDEANLLPPVSFFALFRFSTPLEMVGMVIGLILAVAAGAAQPLMTLIFGRLTTSFTNYAVIAQQISSSGLTLSQDQLDQLQSAKDDLKTQSGHNALYLMAIGVGIFFTTWVYMFIWNVTGELNSKRIREKYLRAVLRQEIAYFDDLGAGEVATRIQTDCHLVQEGTSEKIALIAQFLGSFVAGFALAFARSWRLALACSAIFPVIIIAGGIMMTAMSRFGTGALEHIAKAGSLAEEVIGSIRTVQAFGKQKILGQKFDDHIELSRKAGRKGAYIEAAGLSVMFFSIYSAYALAFFYGGILVTQGRADSGIVINVFMSVLIGAFSMAMAAPEMAAVSKAQSAAAKLFATIDRVPLIDSASIEGLKPDPVHGEITFENVKFHYPSRPNIPILKGLTTTFQAGKTFALVGASGSGKSTVVSLVERFYDPIQGNIKLDGIEIRDLNLKWLRQQIGLVSQEPTLFGTTVRGNVEHGLIGSKWENATDAEKFELVKKACIDANAHDFIMKLPNGYDTMVGERGMLLSGGQKQRVAIARAIVSDPRILLLDEATSALDTQSEGIVQDALDKAAMGRTTITIAHRLSTIRDADRILVMGGGEILEQGTHNELLANENGPYAQLVANQKLAQEAVEDSLKVTPPEDQALSRVKSTPAADSPIKEKEFSELKRAITGRSLASAALDDITARRQAKALEEDKLPSSFGMYLRLLKLNSKQKNWYFFGTIGAICSGMVYPALAILFGYALADFQIQGFDGWQGVFRHALDRKALWYFVTAILAFVATYIQVVAFSGTGWDLNAKLRTESFRAVLRHDIGWFDEDQNSTGAVTSNLAENPQKVQGLFGVTLGTIVQSCATLLGGCIIGLCFGPLLALIGIACIPLLVSGGYIRLKVVVLKDQKMKKLHASSAHLASEAAGAVRTVASLTREDDVDRIYSTALREPMKVNFRTSVKSQALYAASQGITFCIIALVFYIGALWIISGRYGTSHFFTVLTSVIFASMQAGNVFTFVPDASKANSSAASIFRLMDNEPEVDPDSSEGLKLDHEHVKGHIRIEDVHFRYPTRPGVRVLRELNIDVPAGTYVALVGPSGCGKSTTIQLLERFYDPLIGQITLDGVDIKELNVSNFRDQVALVSQEPTLYAGTIKFNILLGANKPMEEITQEEIENACKDANIYDFIMSLPDGFDTEVGGKGSQLSGGQKQRIAIARALIRNPKVLLLDEATSALDSQSEKVVQEALDKASRGRTTIAIAHRLSSIQRSDQIYYFAEGKVAEHGTHQELLAKKGGYYELVQMQNLSRQ